MQTELPKTPGSRITPEAFPAEPTPPDRDGGEISVPGPQTPAEEGKAPVPGHETSASGGEAPVLGPQNSPGGDENSALEHEAPAEGDKTPVLEHETPAGGAEDPEKDGFLSREREYEALSGEIAAMREELRRKKEERELFSLFPELEEGFDRAALPREVLSSLEEGLPLPAAYALFYCRSARAEAMAAAEEEKNRLRSSGGLGQGSGGQRDGGNFTRSEIAAMSRKEVRRYYREIMRSLAEGA